MPYIILAEITYSGGVLRFCTGKGYNAPTAPGYYSPRIQPNGTFTRNLWTGATESQTIGTLTPANGAPIASGMPGMITNAALGGSGSSGWGDLLVSHLDADPSGNQNLLGLLASGIAFDGYPATLLIGEETAAYSTFVPWFSGTVEQMIPSNNGYTFRLRDPLVGVIEQPIGNAKYLGGDTGYVGVEGLDTTIRYQWKPTGYGYADNASAIMCNSSKRIYQAFDYTGTVVKVYDGGVSITAGTNQASLALLLSTAPAAGTFDWYGGADGTWFKLGTPAAKAVTFDGYTGGSGYRTAAQIWNRVLTERCGVSSGSISSADLTALDTATSSAELSGVWYSGGGSRKDALDKAAASVGAAWWVSPLGVYRIKQITAPAVTADVTLRAMSLTNQAGINDIDIIDFQWVADNGGLWGVPPHTVSLSHAVNLTVENEGTLNGDKTSLTDAVGGLDRRLWLGQSTRQAVGTKDTSTAALHKLSTEAQADTWLRNLSDAVAEANRRQAVLVALRRPSQCTVPFTPAVASQLDLAKTVSLYHPAFSLNGVNMLVVAMSVDLFNNTIQLTLRG